MNSSAAGGKTILYVEDDLVVLTAYRDRLQKAGFDVESSVDGLEAMKILSVRAFDLIMLDLMLPGFAARKCSKLSVEIPASNPSPLLSFPQTWKSCTHPC